MIKPVKSKELLDELLREHFIKGTHTNNYLLASMYEEAIQEGRLYYDEQGTNAGIFVENPEFFRLYFFLNDLSTPFLLSAPKPVTMEMIYRGEEKRPTDLLEYWEQNGFQTHLTRDQLFVLKSQIHWQEGLNTAIEIRKGSRLEEAEFAHKLLEASLDLYTGDHMQLEEVREYLEQGNLLIAYSEEQMCGALQLETKNTGIWLGHVAVDSSYRGKGIAKMLVYAYLSTPEATEKTRFQLWVRQDNEAAYGLYRNFGFKYAGRSTVSMLKL